MGNKVPLCTASLTGGIQVQGKSPMGCVQKCDLKTLEDLLNYLVHSGMLFSTAHLMVGHWILYELGKYEQMNKTRQQLEGTLMPSE